MNPAKKPLIEMDENNDGPKSAFQKLYELDISNDVEYIKQSYGDVPYLEWSAAWRLLRTMFQDATYQIEVNGEGLPFFETKNGLFVKVVVNVERRVETEWYPVDGDTPQAIANAHQRGLVKCLGRHGLGLKLWEQAGRMELKTQEPAKPVDVKAAPAKPSKEYVIDLGPKNRCTGKTLDEAGINEVQSNLKFWIDKAKDGKPYEFVKQAQAWLASHTSMRGHKDFDEPPPHADMDISF